MDKFQRDLDRYLERERPEDEPACTKEECAHWESKPKAPEGYFSFHGHCSNASCPNYMDSCPVHNDMPPGVFERIQQERAAPSASGYDDWEHYYDAQ